MDSVEELKVLFEIGELMPDMSVEPSKILLGNAARQSKTKHKCGWVLVFKLDSLLETKKDNRSHQMTIKTKTPGKKVDNAFELQI